MPVRRIRPLCIFTLLASLACAGELRAQSDQKDEEFFESRIRPVLVAHCYECHGPEKEVKGGLRLDSRAGWEQGGDSGPAILPGKPAESLLLQALNYDPNFVEMPPRGRLPDQVIKDFETWIARGAYDPRDSTAPASATAGIDLAKARQHWAYQPIKASPPPTTRDTTWPLGPIDQFILARLEAETLKPASDAERTVLVRRLYFDLLGMPPTVEQLDAALADNQPGAIERLVDELLASPHFGERWARHWLDIVRYGESLTLRGLVLKDAWRFRDYVIEAFNSDRPVDQMIREHVAGDLLPAANVAEQQRQCVASTFLTLGNWNLEEQDKHQLRMDVVDEQLDTIGKAFLAQTIGCARCHDHKFDPIPTKDYYALAGILRNVQTLEDANVSKWLTRPLPVPADEEARFATHEAAVAELESQIKQQNDSIAAIDPASKNPGVVPIDKLPGFVVDEQAARVVGVWVLSQSNKPYLGRGYLHDENTGQGEKTLTFEPQLTKPGKYEVRLAYTSGSNRATNVPVTVFSADGEQMILVNQRQKPDIDGHFASLGTFRFEKDGQCFVIVANDGADGHVVADAVQFLPIDKAEQESVPSTSSLSDEATAALKLARAELAKLKRQLTQLRTDGPVRPTYIGVAEVADIGDTAVHIRGSVHQLGDPVARGFLQAALVIDPPALPAKQSGRIELGDWLTRPDQPLTARVYVNRVWHWLFGAGLVRTTDNFGVAGEAPSHPELLDHLAAEFVADGWSTKRLIRRLVLSRTYQLSSVPPDDALRADPENRLLSHARRRRLEAECLRDALLTVSGELDLTVGGSILKANTVADYDYVHDDVRRSVYSPVLRNRLPEIFEVFDFADSSVVTGCRNSSTVAPQALYLLNNPFVIARARQAAERIQSSPANSTADRIDLAFRCTLGRLPSDEERRIAQQHLASPPTADLNAAPSLDAWQTLFHALFGSLDFRYLD